MKQAYVYIFFIRNPQGQVDIIHIYNNCTYIHCYINPTSCSPNGLALNWPRANLLSWPGTALPPSRQQWSQWARNSSSKRILHILIVSRGLWLV